MILSQPSKKFAGGAAGGGGEFGEGAVFFVGDEGGGVGDVGGFAAFAAVGDGGEERGVGFEHEGAEGSGADGFADGGGVFEGGDSGEPKEAIEVGDLFLFGGGADEAMKNGAGLRSEGF